ncbi:MAG: tRNA (adenosine(37)-N6)-dimethylallyltransferase MiaA [Patescibacteria group bacterium]
MSKPKIISIAGPTASGKTDLAVRIAKEFDGEIVSTDSRTIYREMNIGTAKPKGTRYQTAEMTPEQVEEKGIRAKDLDISITDLFADKPLIVDGVPHWGFDLVDPNEDFTVADFKAYAEQKIEDILFRGKMPILAGGTGLYISAVIDNLSFSDVAPNPKLRQEFQELSDNELLARLRKVDKDALETVDTANRRRVVRALEIIETTGQPLAAQQQKNEPKYEVLQLGIDTPREILYERIDDRVDKMIALGLVDEVRALRDKYGCQINAMTGIGYRQICAFLDGTMSLKDAIEILKRDSRHYAKRQMTWFSRDDRIHWITTANQAIELVGRFLS